jgi:endonuclease/exonuclease/phosphatase (EEP) superfamily protein YafD
VRKTRRPILTACGIVSFGIAFCALASRYLPISNHVVLITSAFSPYLLLFAPVSMALLILARRWVLVILSTGLTVMTLVVQLPIYIGSDTAAMGDVRLRVISANLRDGWAEPQHLVRLAQDQTDVLAVQELTADEVDRLSAAGIDMTFPYRWLDARGGAQGVGLWSRFPLDATRRVGGYTFAMVTAQIRVPGVTRGPTVVVGHLPGPWPQPIDGWRRDMAHLPATLREVAERAGTGCVIVAADLNSTRDMRPFRSLLTDGYQDAAEQSGSGIQPTFPGNSRLPPVIAIDHIVTRNCTATSVQAMSLPGSDHRALVATVMTARSP